MPDGQLHVNEFTSLLQVPPLSHGDDKHSSMSAKRKKIRCVKISVKGDLTAFG